MRGWLAEFLRTRDGPSLGMSDSLASRERLGGLEHPYPDLSSKWPVQVWNVGHIRAALLAAAADRTALFVKVPFQPTMPNLAAAHLSDLRIELEQETGFHQARFRITLADKQSSLVVCLFTVRELTLAHTVLDRV